jgi:catechol 2,3-dioxygenase-like lactoylglutathione lyase family enzyme
MLKSFEHIGMTVSDMDRTVAFYCGLLGLRLHFSMPAAACWKSLRRRRGRRKP